MKDTKQRIIKQALHYFNSNDYERTSLQGIADALGITKGGIYHYFGSKDELLREAVLYTLDSLINQFTLESPDYQKLTLHGKLQLLFNWSHIGAKIEETTGIDIFRDYENMLYLIFTAVRKFPELRTQIDGFYTSFLVALTELFREGQKSGEITTKQDPETLAFEIIGFGEGTMLLGGFIQNPMILPLAQKTFEEFWQRVTA